MKKNSVVFSSKEVWIFAFVIFILGFIVSLTLFYNFFLKPDIDKVNLLTDALANFGNSSNTAFVRDYINENMTIKDVSFYCRQHIGKCQEGISILISGICGVG
jgi:hypothetical protein